ncbi:excalibur calcium-binding domain-containing protein [Streptomyces sp. NK08204]|uniref:excalibur calcium-binding domain-containing protein n=1 Tax=Streptomyces sp. NK08204 TaxID=2873260 RepID=UPI001CEDD066|nr:excalibur calcium-binding domain-containing protein [Streptomyces sp. NK08204]
MRGEPRYGPPLDRDGDGIGCEWGWEPAQHDAVAVPVAPHPTTGSDRRYTVTAAAASCGSGRARVQRLPHRPPRHAAPALQLPHRHAAATVRPDHRRTRPSTATGMTSTLHQHLGAALAGTDK